MYSKYTSGRNFVRSEDGSVLIMVGLFMPVIAAFVGGAVEYSTALSRQQDLQTSADAAALAGAKVVLTSTSDAREVATQAFHINYNGSGHKVTPIVSIDGARVTVAASDNIKTPLMSLAHVSNLNFDVEAVAEADAASPGPVCVLLKDETLGPSFHAMGSNTINAPECEIHVSSRKAEAGLIHSVTEYDVLRTCIAGNFEFRGGSQNGIERVWADCKAAVDPYAGRLPLPVSGPCVRRHVQDDAHVVLEPGTYCGDWTFNGSTQSIVLNPGVYVFNNARFRFRGDLEARDVTIFLADKHSTFQPIGEARYNLIAPRTGTYADIALFEAPDITDKSVWRMVGNAESRIEGIVYLPSRHMEWKGNASGTGLRMNLVLNSMALFGNTTLNISPYDLQQIYADPESYTNPNVVTLKLIK